MFLRSRVWAGWVLLATVGAAGAVVAAAADDDTAVVHRDRWGVPHIYAPSAEVAAYAHGWLQAEDRLEDVLLAYARANGRLASVLGEAHVDSDRDALVAGHARLARAAFADLGDPARAMAVAFADGFNDYMRGHPDRVPEWAAPVQAHDVLAVFHAFAYAWPAGQARSELKRVGETTATRWSNQWVVGAGRSAEGGPIALIDPHLVWTPESLFYEVHFHGGELDFYGFAIPGTPVAALGHTDTFSLAATTGGPDCADIYELKIDPTDPARYVWGEGHREFIRQTLQIAVAGDTDGAAPASRTFDLLRSHHGPVVRREGDRAWARRTAYDDSAGLYEQWVELWSAQNLGEFLAAMAHNEAPPQNFMYADTGGNLLYLRAGRVPRREESYRWDRPVPGWTAATEWNGFHPPQDWVQTLNPPTGWMQNCNVAPSMMMPGSPMTADRYRKYLYNTRPDRMNARGRRASDLLRQPGPVTLQRAREIAMDTFVEESPRWQQALGTAWSAYGEDFPELRPAVDLLTAWNGRMDADNREAALFRGWMRTTRAKGSGVPRSEIQAGAAPGDDALLRTLSAAATELKRLRGRLDVPYRDFQRVRRGEVSWPAAGCRADGISTLRSVRGARPDGDGISWVGGGQFATTLVVLTPGNVRSFSAVPFGQSNDPTSPHYADQGRELFSHSKLKPTWYSRAAVLEHLESTTRLTYRGGSR